MLICDLLKKFWGIGLVSEKDFIKYENKKVSIYNLWNTIKIQKYLRIKKPKRFFFKIGLEEMKKQYSLKRRLLRRQNIDFDTLKKINPDILVPKMK